MNGWNVGSIPRYGLKMHNWKQYIPMLSMKEHRSELFACHIQRTRATTTHESFAWILMEIHSQQHHILEHVSTL
jgi:hypothetical protein